MHVLVLLSSLWRIQTNRYPAQAKKKPHNNFDDSEYRYDIKSLEKGSKSQAEESCTKPDLFSKEKLLVQEREGSPTSVTPETDADSSLGDIVETNAIAEFNRSRNETVLVLSQQLIIAITVCGFFGLIVYVIHCAAVRPTLNEKGSDQELETSDVDQHKEIETIFEDRHRQANSDRDGACTEMETYFITRVNS